MLDRKDYTGRGYTVHMCHTFDKLGLFNGELLYALLTHWERNNEDWVDK